MVAFLEAKKWFIESLKPKLDEIYEVKVIDQKGGDLGDVAGLQFDNDQRGGYAYIWSNGFASYQLVDYVKGVELIEDTTEEVSDCACNEIFFKVIDKLGI